MNWIFSAFLIVSILHMIEEYFYPGGFMEVMKRLNPRFAPFVTVPIAVVINGLQLLLGVVAIIVGTNMLTFSMSVAALLFINGWVHTLGSVRTKGYVPGVITGIAFYLPLSVYAYYLFISSNQLTLNQVFVTFILGLFFQAVPLSYFVIASVVRRTSMREEK